MANEPVPIGLSEPLFGVRALSILFPGACLAVFAAVSSGAALASLGGHQGHAGAAGLVAAASGALFIRFLYDFVPQRAWLDGSVLTTERAGHQRQCNLATAEMIKLSSTMPPLTRNYSPAVPVLRARQRKGSKPVRLVLRGNDLQIVPAAELLLLAEAIESRPVPDPRARKVCQRLRKLAAPPEPRPTLDWSFRTNPQGTQIAIDQNQHHPADDFTSGM